MEEEVSVYRVLAPRGWSCSRVTGYLRVDPYQTRVSRHLVPLTHPRTGKTLPLKEFVQDIIGDSRFAIEATDGLVFVSRIQNSAFGSVFIPVKTLPKDVLDRKEKEDKLPTIYK
jgi:hypothetical protein